MPYDVVQNEVKEAKAGAEIVSEALALGYVRDVLQPTVDKAGSLSLGPRADHRQRALPARRRAAAQGRRWSRRTATYLAAHKVDKPDIWAARDVELPPGKRLRAGAHRVWDSGVDTALFPDRVVNEAPRQAGGDRLRQVREPGDRRAARRFPPICAASCRR